MNTRRTTTIAVSEFAGVRYRCETFFSQPRAGDAVVAAEGEQHPAGRGDRRQAAERHRDRDARRQQVAQPEACAEVVL